MDKFLAYLGGIIGGYGLVHAPVEGTVFSVLDPVLNLIGSLAMVVFAGAFIVHGLRSLFGR